MTAPRLHALLQLGKLLAPNDNALAARVTLAFEQPDAYVRAHAARLDGRSIYKPHVDLAWIALIDALADANVLAEIDWKSNPEEVADRLEQLPGFPKAGARWLRDNELLDSLACDECLQLFGKRLLARRKRQLASLSIGSDCYCLVVVPAAQASLLADLAKAAGYHEATLFDGTGVEEPVVDDTEQRAAKAAARANHCFVLGDGPDRRFRWIREQPSAYNYLDSFQVPASTASKPELHEFANARSKRTSLKALLDETIASGWRRVTYREFSAMILSLNLDTHDQSSRD